MDNNNQNSAPNPVNSAPIMEKSNGSIGPIIGAIIILAVIVLGGLYFWDQRQERDANDAETAQVLESINTQGSADDTSSIENDLNSTDIDSLDAELNAS